MQCAVFNLSRYTSSGSAGTAGSWSHGDGDEDLNL
jgi:hypothetical protein